MALTSEDINRIMVARVLGQPPEEQDRNEEALEFRKSLDLRAPANTTIHPPAEWPDLDGGKSFLRDPDEADDGATA